MTYPLEEAVGATERPKVFKAGVDDVKLARARRPRKSPRGPEGAVGPRSTEVEEELSCLLKIERYVG